MNISSRTPDGLPNTCPICGQEVRIAPSPGSLDAPCPRCGQRLWFVGAMVVAPLFDVESRNLDAGAVSMPDDIVIDGRLTDLLPFSIASENHILPLGQSAERLFFAVAAPIDVDTVEKLRFIVNREVFVVPTDRRWIDQQIAALYGFEAEA